ncbi:non-canonical purine NTP pyrophosphatase [candidate division WWE3 bacterium]|uniref:Non-canonical purine NTP pyrophosphatase n=1 Tax=candidate division WWE3 bacterium TaxID=2053526 RepID=A0A955LW67_UNCKA|nr:non-canonical purine NTP pyrophosphatase [candidate division WWE3 bacterium]
MSLYFITGNQDKFQEAQSIIPSLEQLDIDLPEIQSLDPYEIIKAKLESAKQEQDGEFVIEDTSLYFDGLNGLPGPFIKWFYKTVGNEGMYQMCEAFDNFAARADVLLGYTDTSGTVNYFVGSIKGTIVAPRGESGFGWDPIFLPEGSDKTFAEIKQEEKNVFSMRRIAFEKMAEYLNSDKNSE